MSSELLISLPRNMCRSLPVCDPELNSRCFASFDPPDTPLGSGGGSAYLLEQGWKAAGSNSFAQWLSKSQKLLIHSGGESRRLPAYAANGKLLMPVPALRWKFGQRIDQTLLDMQEPFLREVAAASQRSAVLIASGDVLLAGDAEDIPDADVVLLGMWTTPEMAQHFGVMFCDRENPCRLIKFLQKPAAIKTRELSRDHLFLVDVGVWLLSERAVNCLMRKCGWDAKLEQFEQGLPSTYDLYGQWALHLGAHPEAFDEDVSSLTVAVVPVKNGEFYHFGNSRDIVDSSYQLQNKVMDQTRLGAVPTSGQPRQFVLNSFFDARRSEANESLWIENSFVPGTWKLASRHVITGVPENNWSLSLAEGRCLDVVPLAKDDYGIRCYGYTDAFRGVLGGAYTLWMGQPVTDWFTRRGISLDEAGLCADSDLQCAQIFPVIRKITSAGELIQWMLAETPAADETLKKMWLKARRLSARELSQHADLERLYGQRREFRRRILPVMAKHGVASLFYKLDIGKTAQEYADSALPLVPEEEICWRGNQVLPVHDQMFRSEVSKWRGDIAAADRYEAEAFRRLHNLLIDPLKAEKTVPVCTVMEDQIVWARSPARVDIAGGWSDTPPYCLEHGGSVFNVAFNLNGQPPIQVFVRNTKERALVIRSIDLGLKEELYTYEDVGAYRGIGSGFAIARAAFALAGFHPDFNGVCFQTLEKQLENFGGGIEVSLLAAVPKGSGMGTSSILAGTLLGGLADFCGLAWDRMEIARRVSALEQMLGTGGGWQDQYGGLFPGAKLIETRPGLAQAAVIRWAPGEFFDEAVRSGRMLLYYTGITRIAHSVLGEIVRSMFLNQAKVLAEIDAIAANGHKAFEALQRNDWTGFVESVRRSWTLNQSLDSGVNPPEVQSIISCIEGKYEALKLAGAGGGGYMLILAKDRNAAAAIRQALAGNPPNNKSRFIDIEVSRTGLQISRS